MSRGGRWFGVPLGPGIKTPVLVRCFIELGDPTPAPARIPIKQCDYTHSAGEEGGGQGCNRTEGAQRRLGRRLEGVCQSGWGRLLSVTNAVEAGTWRQGDSGWAYAGRPGKGGGTPPPPAQCIPGRGGGGLPGFGRHARVGDSPAFKTKCRGLWDAEPLFRTNLWRGAC